MYTSSLMKVNFEITCLFIGMRFKKINPKEENFYIVETSQRTFSVFDSEFDLPIYYGSWNMCEGIIKNIKKHMAKSNIHYYVKEKSGTLTLSPLWSHKV